MGLQKAQIEKSISLAIGNAINRLPLLSKEDRLAVVNEYKEWLVDKEIKEEVMILKEIK